LEARPQEYTEHSNISGTNVRIYRLDYAAKIETPEGLKLILIELQKATFSNDVMRFRDYLGSQYRNKENRVMVKVKVQGSGKNKGKEIEKEMPLPIYCLYFLGSDAGIDKVPVVAINPVACDVATGEPVNTKDNDFVNSLHHRSWIIQVKYLKEPRRTELERLLSIFDQGRRTADVHILDINEDDFDEKYHPLIRRLKMAASNPEIREEMKVEDLYLDYLRQYVREETAEMAAELIQKNKALAKKDKALADNKKALAKKDKALAEKDQALAEKNNELERLKAFLQQSGFNLDYNKFLIS
jgi:hypothetical protein